MEPDDLEDLYTKVGAAPPRLRRQLGAAPPRLWHQLGAAPPRWRQQDLAPKQRTSAWVLPLQLAAVVSTYLAQAQHLNSNPARLPPPRQVHEAIRADPAAKPKARSKPAEAKRWKEVKLTYEQRKDKLKVGGMQRMRWCSRGEGCLTGSLKRTAKVRVQEAWCAAGKPCRGRHLLAGRNRRCAPCVAKPAVSLSCV